jgi:DNA-binding NtrC family response regulator
LNVFPITVPPLRKRKEDIPPLVEWFVNAFNTKYGKSIGEVSESLMEELQDYPWPGNVRQLRNVLERAVISSSESVLKLAAPLPAQMEADPFLTGRENNPSGNRMPGDQFEMLTLRELERKYITEVLQRCQWKVSGKASASEALDLPPSTLRSKMKKLGIRQGAS